VLLCRFSIFSLGDAKFAQKRQIKTCRVMFFSARKQLQKQNMGCLNIRKF